MAKMYSPTEQCIFTSTDEKCNSSLENFNTGLIKLAVTSTDMMCSF